MIHPVGFEFNGRIFWGVVKCWFCRGFWRFWVFGCGEFVVKMWWMVWVRWFVDRLFLGGGDFADF
jgi:hypothetical protein